MIHMEPWRSPSHSQGLSLTLKQVLLSCTNRNEMNPQVQYPASRLNETTAMKVTELKVCIACQKCKTQILKAVTKLAGIVEVSVDEQKGILRVVGDVDPIQVAKQVRKTGKTAVFGSFGERKPGPANPPKKKPEPENPLPDPLPPYCSACHLVEVRYVPYGGPYCSIM